MRLRRLHLRRRASYNTSRPCFVGGLFQKRVHSLPCGRLILPRRRMSCRDRPIQSELSQHGNLLVLDRQPSPRSLLLSDCSEKNGHLASRLAPGLGLPGMPSAQFTSSRTRVPSAQFGTHAKWWRPMAHTVPRAPRPTLGESVFRMPCSSQLLRMGQPMTNGFAPHA